MALLEDTIKDLARAGDGMHDVACPECGPMRQSAVNQRREVLRLWVDSGFITFKCARCELSGWLHDKDADWKKGPELKKKEPLKASGVPQFLWQKAQPLAGSLAEAYLHSRSCYVASPNLRFLPAKGDHAPAMVARFGTGPIIGVHLTKLKPGGSGKAGSEKDKIMLGHGTAGQPIVVASNEDRTELFIAEGIEDTASLAIATGWSAWAAGSAERIAQCTPRDGYGPIYLSVDDDPAGSRALAKAKAIRSDVVPVHFSRVFGAKLDANKVLQLYGIEGILAAIDWCDAQERFARKEVNYEATVAAMARINAMEVKHA